MRTPTFTMTDKAYQFERMHEFLDQKQKQQHHILKLPCHKVNIELTKPEDTYVECPMCHKHYLLSHSSVSNKLWTVS